MPAADILICRPERGALFSEDRLNRLSFFHFTQKLQEGSQFMLNRDIKVTFRLNKSESEKLKKRVKKSGLSQEAYLRQLINGLVPTDAPPPDYFVMMKELRHIGVNMNQIAQKAHGLNMLDVKRYDENAALLKKAVADIHNAVMLARKIERKIE